MAAEALKEKIVLESTNERTFLITSHVLSDLDDLTSELVYLNEGSILFNDSIDMLKELTGEQKLSRAVASIIRNIPISMQTV